jgi:hypothetical protein
MVTDSFGRATEWNSFVDPKVKHLVQDEVRWLAPARDITPEALRTVQEAEQRYRNVAQELRDPSIASNLQQAREQSAVQLKQKARLDRERFETSQREAASAQQQAEEAATQRRAAKLAKAQEEQRALQAQQTQRAARMAEGEQQARQLAAGRRAKEEALRVAALSKEKQLVCLFSRCVLFAHSSCLAGRSVEPLFLVFLHVRSLPGLVRQGLATCNRSRGIVDEPA